ncbi:MAG: FecR domain-containing protein [Prevotellaceae bacterium]|jgi:ferric-dicitrate binding protein FerR (iron transport regulator)|nr:FecR domain-containing protein [Prevotellaceae bacterium]
MLQDIDRIIARHLGGDATPEEQNLLRAWLAESEQNRTFFAAIVSDAKPDTEQAWKKFERHMQQSTSASAPASAPASVPAPAPPRTAAWRLALRYAAAIALLAGAATLAWIQLDSNNASQQVWTVAKSDNEAYTYMLHDSTSVSLNKGSRLSCIGDYGDGKRELQLEGEAFFEVAASSSGLLVVHAEETLIRDIGTAFNVQAYPDSDSVTVFVQRGEVHFYGEASSGLILKAGETGTFDRRTKIFSRSQTDANAASYATKVFVFRDKPLDEAIALIGKVYDSRIYLDDSAAAAKTISVTFDNESLEEIVEVIGETMHLQVAQSADGYVLKQ